MACFLHSHHYFILTTDIAITNNYAIKSLSSDVKCISKYF